MGRAYAQTLGEAGPSVAVADLDGPAPMEWQPCSKTTVSVPSGCRSTSETRVAEGDGLPVRARIWWSRLTINLAREPGKHKINVNAIAPGMTADYAIRSMGFSFDPELEAKRMSEVVVRKAFGPPEDLRGALLFLVSPAGD